MFRLFQDGLRYISVKRYAPTMRTLNLNFCLITNLTTVGKTLERFALTQLRRFIEGSPNSNPLHSAYRACYSTETAMIKVVSDMLTAAYSKSPSVLPSLDISAAYDTVDLRRLCQRAPKNCSSLMTWYSTVCSRILPIVNISSQWMVADHQRNINRQALRWCSARIAFWTLLLAIFTKPVGKLIDNYVISCHQFADDAQLYALIKSLSPSSLAAMSRCRDWLAH